MKKYILGLMLVALVIVPLVSNGQSTNAQVNALIAQLQAQIASLQAQLAVLLVNYQRLYFSLWL